MTGPTNYERSITVDLPYAEAVERTRVALAEQGFGVLSQIDVQATLREKRGLEMESYAILGACNVVVSARDGGSKIQIVDPMIMASVMGRDELQPIAQEAARRLQTVLDTLLVAGA